MCRVHAAALWHSLWPSLTQFIEFHCSDKYSFPFVSFHCRHCRHCRPCRQGKMLGNNRNKENQDIILSNQTLVIRQIERHTAGNYTCIATNRLGESSSAPLHLHVKCKFFISFFLIFFSWRRALASNDDSGNKLKRKTLRNAIEFQ